MHTARRLAPLLALGLLAVAAPVSSVQAGTDAGYSAHRPDDHAGKHYQRAKARDAKALKARKAAQARERRLRAARYRAHDPWAPFVGPPGLFF